MCGDLKTFMRDSYNKAELFLMIANCISQIRDVPTFIIATINEKEISNDFDIDLYIDSFDIIQSTRSRPKILVFDRCRKGYEKLSIAGSDTDIVVIALYRFYDFGVNEI